MTSSFLLTMAVLFLGGRLKTSDVPKRPFSKVTNLFAFKRFQTSNIKCYKCFFSLLIFQTFHQTSAPTWMVFVVVAPNGVMISTKTCLGTGNLQQTKSSHVAKPRTENKYLSFFCKLFLVQFSIFQGFGRAVFARSL